MDRPLAWSRRNGPWQPVDVLWVGAAPGNAGGLGSSDMGAHGTRIPFGGDIAGGNLDVLFASMGITRNDTFIVASLNQLPEKGGGEPTTTELAAPVGRYPDSVALLRDTVIATRPRLIVALGHVALRTLAAALTRPYAAPVGEPQPVQAPLRLPTVQRLTRAGLERDVACPWPDGFPMDAGFISAWSDAWGGVPGFQVLPVMHPSAQNMSPFAGAGTLFHTRMVTTRDALVRAVQEVLRRQPPSPRPGIPEGGGIYSLPEWQERIAPRHRQLEELWRARGV